MDGAQDGQKASLGSHHPGHRDSGTRVDGYFHSFDPNHDKHETGRQHETGRHDGKLPNGDSVPHAISRVRRENTAPAAPVRATAPAQTRPRTSTVPVPASVSPIPESIEDGGPNLPTQHSPNFTLNRRGSRSIHSDLHAFAEDASITSHANEDAARWADAIRAKRAAKRRRLEEEEDNRVLVGTKVGPEHSNYSIMYNMLTGIRVGVSRCNAKVDRALTAADFSAEHKFSFDIVGSELTPSAKYDFKFKDYAPWVFRHLRQLFHLDPADYLISLTSKYILSELTSPGKSGSFFYFSRDYKFIIKTISQREHKFLRKILKEYYEHVSQNPDTLISQFYGLHRVKEPYGRKLHFVVMNNLFPPHRDIHQTYDLKGSTQGRNFQEDNLRDNPRATLKDLNWLRRHMTIHLGPRKRAAFIKQLERDVGLLKRLNIMDYSLLLGIHDMQRGNKDNIRDSTLSIVQPEPEAPPLQRTVSKLEQARKARELRRKITSTGPTAIEPSMLPADEHRERKNFAFYSDDGGLRATDEDDGPADEIYYFGVIDCLTRYNTKKHLETFFKSMKHTRSQISAIPPPEYGDRFFKFISAQVKTLERVVQDQREDPEGRLKSKTVQCAERAAEKSERKGSVDEDQVPTRQLSTEKSPDPLAGGVILPVVEEARTASEGPERILSIAEETSTASGAAPAG